MPNVTVACLHAWCIEQSTSRWLIHLQQIPFCKRSLDSFIEEVLSERYSDRGTNFLLAERELREGVHRWNQSQIHESLRQKGVEWHFNPPLSPSSGGAWEILVKSVKRILHSLAGERALDDEALHSLLVEIENILTIDRLHQSATTHWTYPC